MSPKLRASEVMKMRVAYYKQTPATLLVPKR